MESTPVPLPAVSVCLPAWNGEAYIRRALDSLVDQSFDNWELLVSDDGSTDATWEICCEYRDRLARMKLLRNPNRGGAWNNFKYLLSQAQGEFLVFASQDDYWHPDFLQHCYNDIRNDGDACMVGVNVQTLAADGKPITTFSFGGRTYNREGWRSLLHDLLFTREKLNFLFHGILRTACLRDVCELERLPINHDRHLIAVLMGSGHVRHVDETLYFRTIGVGELLRRERAAQDAKAGKTQGQNTEPAPPAPDFWQVFRHNVSVHVTSGARAIGLLLRHPRVPPGRKLWLVISIARNCVEYPFVYLQAKKGARNPLYMLLGK